MNIAIRCRCGQLQGEVDAHDIAARVTCYCKDCQAYARFLDPHPDFLDAAGGTEVVAALPAAVRFTQGSEHLACMSLGPKGILRWYAACCRTPLGNTPRGAKVAYVGLVRSALAVSADELERHAGPLQAAVNTDSARGAVATTPGPSARVIFKVGRMIVKARLNGRYKQTPFFDAGGRAPVRSPQILTLAERRALDSSAP